MPSCLQKSPPLAPKTNFLNPNFDAEVQWKIRASCKANYISDVVERVCRERNVRKYDQDTRQMQGSFDAQNLCVDRTARIFDSGKGPSMRACGNSNVALVLRGRNRQFRNTCVSGYVVQGGWSLELCNWDQ
eukprot:EST42790.1 Hypothetical protein SS50377_17559 [Spironucleus salmonicida]